MKVSGKRLILQPGLGTPPLIQTYFARVSPLEAPRRGSSPLQQLHLHPETQRFNMLPDKTL